MINKLFNRKREANIGFLHKIENPVFEIEWIGSVSEIFEIMSEFDEDVKVEILTHSETTIEKRAVSGSIKTIRNFDGNKHEKSKIKSLEKKAKSEIDVNIISAINPNMIPLFLNFCSFYSNWNAIDLVLSKGLYKETEENLSMNFLHWAAAFDDHNTIKIAVEQNIELNRISELSCSPLDLAIHNNCAESILFLKASGGECFDSLDLIEEAKNRGVL